MKKNMLITLILCIGLLCACKPSNANISPATSIDPPSNIYIGMPLGEFKELYPDRDENPDGTCFYYWTQYAFFEDTNGNPVVVHFTYDDYLNGEVSSVDAYDKNEINLTDEAFGALSGGMTVQEIVSRVGLPDPVCFNHHQLRWTFSNENVDVKYLIQLTEKNGQPNDDFALYLLHRMEGDVHSYPIGSEPWYPSK